MEEIAASTDFQELIGSVMPRIVAPKLDLSDLGAALDFEALMPSFDFPKLVPDLDLAVFSPGIDAAPFAEAVSLAASEATKAFAATGVNDFSEAHRDTLGAITAASTQLLKQIPKVDIASLLEKVDTSPFREQIAAIDAARFAPDFDVSSLVPDLDVEALFPQIDMASLLPDIKLENLVNSTDFRSLIGEAASIDWTTEIGNDAVEHLIGTHPDTSELEPVEVNAAVTAFVIAGLAQMVALSHLERAVTSLLVDSLKTMWILYVITWEFRQTPGGGLVSDAASFLLGRATAKRSDSRPVKAPSADPPHLVDLTALVLRNRARINEIAGRRNASNVRVFGSVARGEATATSDIDLLVDLDDDVGLVGLAGLERELTDLLGCAVDVVPARYLKRAARKAAEAESISL